MISRFLRRSVCCLLALVTLCLCLSPALVQPAQAVAGFDDATLAVGLLFMSWAGVTFATSQGAYTATSNFLQSSVNGLKAASHVAANYVVDGTLKLCQGVKDAFSSFLPEVNSAFRTPDGSLAGAIVGSTPVGVPLPIGDSAATYKVPVSSVAAGDPFTLTVGSKVYSVRFRSGNKRIEVLDERNSVYASVSYEYTYTPPKEFYDCYFSISGDRYSFNYSYSDSSGKVYNSSLVFGTVSSSDTPVVTYAPSDGVAFQRSKNINGTQVQEITFVPGGVWESDPSDPERPKPDMSQWPGLSLALLLSMLNNPGSDDPNLDPEQMIEELKKALNGTSGGGSGTGTTTPTTPGGSTDGTDVADGSLGKPYAADWKGVFPFCVPFDLIEFLGVLNAAPEAPVIHWRFYVPRIVDYDIVIDLSVFNDVAQIMRTMELLAFCIGLILLTRNIIRG